MRCLQKSPLDHFQSARAGRGVEACDDHCRWTRESACAWWEDNELALENNSQEVPVGSH